MKDHTKTHDGQEPFECDICDEIIHTFALKVDLEVHMKTHDGHESFRCDVCAKLINSSIQIV